MLGSEEPFSVTQSEGLGMRPEHWPTSLFTCFSVCTGMKLVLLSGTMQNGGFLESSKTAGARSEILSEVPETCHGSFLNLQRECQGQEWKRN